MATESGRLISRVLGAYRVTDGDDEYVLAWGIHNTGVQRAWLAPRGDDPCSYDFRVEPAPMQVLTPAAAIARGAAGTICEFIYVWGENGSVRADAGATPATPGPGYGTTSGTIY